MKRRLLAGASALTVLLVLLIRLVLLVLLILIILLIPVLFIAHDLNVPFVLYLFLFKSVGKIRQKLEFLWFCADFFGMLLNENQYCC